MLVKANVIPLLGDFAVLETNNAVLWSNLDA
jgi:hypothetical protein